MAIAKLNFSRSNYVSPLNSLGERLSAFGNNMIAGANKDEELRLQRERQATQDARQARMDLLATPGTTEYANAVLEKAKLEQEANKLDPNYELKQKMLKSSVVGTDEWKAAKDVENQYKREDPEYILKNKISQLQYKKLYNDLNSDSANRAMGADYINALNKIPQTKVVRDEAEVKAYTGLKSSLESQINKFKGLVERSKNPETTKKLKSGLEDLQLRLSNLKEPVGSEVPISKKEYLNTVMGLQKNMPFGNASQAHNFQKILKDRVDLLYPEKSNSLTPYQILQEKKDINKMADKEKTAMSLATNAFGKDKLEKLLKDNPNLTPDALTKLADKKLNKEYSSTSISDAISKIVVDGDTDSNRNISANKEELNRILKEKFKGNKADMVQEIKGFYDVQGTGTFKNWGNNSPIGDALDNFISKYKD